MTSPSIRRVHAGTYLAYGLGDMLGSGAMTVIGAWVLYFYTSFCGLSAVQAAAIFAIARIVDAVASPLIGQFSDRLGETRFGQRFGRRRGFLLLALPLLPSFALMWVSGQSFGYYLATYVFFEVVYATVLIPYETLAAEMSDDYKTRARFAGARIATGQLAAIAAGILPAMIVERLGKQSADTFFTLGLIFSGVIVASIAIVWACTWERPPRQHAAAAPARSSLLSPRRMYADVLSTLRVRAFRQHLGMYLGGYTAIDMFNAAFTYFVVFALLGPVGSASELLGAMSTMQLAGLAVFIPLVIRFGPARCYRVAATCFGAAVLMLLVVAWSSPQDVMTWCLVAVLLAGFGRSGLIYIPWNVYNYMADVDELLTRERREGVFAGTMTFVRKAAQALAVMLVGVILELSGFASGAQTQPASAVLTITLLMAVGPFVFLALGSWVAGGFILNRDTHGLLMQTIAAFKRGELAAIDSVSRGTVESMTGHPFASLWGGNPTVSATPEISEAAKAHSTPKTSL